MDDKQQIFNSPSFLLVRVTRAHRNMMRQKMQALGLHRGQPFVLFALEKKDGLSNAELADFLEVTPATLTNKVKRMEKIGLLVRRRDPEDERINRIYLTEKGRGIIGSVRETAVNVNLEMFKGFGRSEVEQFKAYLQRLLANIDSMT